MRGPDGQDGEHRSGKPADPKQKSRAPRGFPWYHLLFELGHAPPFTEGGIQPTGFRLPVFPTTQNRKHPERIRLPEESFLSVRCVRRLQQLLDCRAGRFDHLLDGKVGVGVSGQRLGGLV